MMRIGILVRNCDQDVVALPSLYGCVDMKITTGQLATASSAEREILQQLLLFNLFLQIVDGIFSYSRLSSAAPLPPSWSAMGGLLYYKVLASALLALIAWLGKRKPELAANALVVSATIYTAFALYSIYCLIA